MPSSIGQHYYNVGIWICKAFRADADVEFQHSFLCKLSKRKANGSQ